MSRGTVFLDLRDAHTDIAASVEGALVGWIERIAEAAHDGYGFRGDDYLFGLFHALGETLEVGAELVVAV